MRIGNAISTARRIDPSVKSMTKHNDYTYGWALDHSGWTSTNIGSTAGTNYPYLAQLSKWDFSVVSDGWKFTRSASPGTGFAGYMGFPNNLDLIPEGVSSGGSGAVLGDGILAANKYFAMVITFHTGFDYPQGSSSTGAALAELTTGTPTSTIIKNDARPPIYINGVQISDTEGAVLDDRRSIYTGLFKEDSDGGSDALAATEKGIPLTIVFDMSGDTDWSSIDSDSTLNVIRHYMTLAIQTYNISFTIHGYILSADDPSKIHVTKLPVPIGSPT